MAQVRREPRFVEMELLAPVRSLGASAHSAMDNADISDAVFETIGASASLGGRENVIQMPQKAPVSPQISSIGLLKQNIPFDAVSYSGDSTLSPGFLVFTLFSAFGVFWLCGGHALLY